MKTETAIIIGTQGFVWVCSSVEVDETWATLVNARCIRVWGTTKGLNELVQGPTKNTILDTAAPVISLAQHALVAVIPADQAGWAKSLT